MNREREQSIIPHEWLYPSSLEEAISVQKLLATYVIREDAFETITHLCGTDTSNALDTPDEIHAAAVVLDQRGLKPKAIAQLSCKHLFPYVSGFLAFREAPSIIEAFRQLPFSPDLIMADGQGICHPRGLGIASQLGVLLDKPTIGVAKSILIGEPQGILGSEIGDTIPLVWKGKHIANLVRTKRRCNPLIVSIGHRISLSSATRLVLESTQGYRLPEPTRHAHLTANEQRKRSL